MFSFTNVLVKCCVHHPGSSDQFNKNTRVGESMQKTVMPLSFKESWWMQKRWSPTCFCWLASRRSSYP